MSFLDKTVGTFVKYVSADLLEKPNDQISIIGSWFLSPTQHGVEWITYATIAYLGTIFGTRMLLKPNTPQSKLLKLYNNSAPMTILETLVVISCLASWGLIFYFKFSRNELMSLLQPCHMNLLLLTFIILTPKNYNLPHFLFNVYSCSLWTTFCAIATPDLRGYTSLLEIFNFFFEHYLLLLAPFILYYSEHYVLFPASLKVVSVSFCINLLYHYPVLHTIALTTGANLNYLLSPPLGPLEVFGKYYRFFTGSFSFILALVFRFSFTALMFTTVDYLSGGKTKAGKSKTN